MVDMSVLLLLMQCWWQLPMVRTRLPGLGRQTITLMFSLSTNTLHHIRVQASGGVLAVEVPRQEVGGEAEHHGAEVDNVHGGRPPVRMPAPTDED